MKNPIFNPNPNNIGKIAYQRDSASGKKKGMAIIDSKQVYHVYIYAYDDSDVGAGGSPFWNSHLGPSFTDTLEKAKEIIEENLK